MNIMFNNAPPLVQRGRKILTQFDRSLTADYHQVLATLQKYVDQPTLVVSLGPILTAISELIREVGQMSDQLDAEHVPEVCEQLSAKNRLFLSRLQATPDDDTDARLKLAHIIQLITSADHDFRQLQQGAQSTKDDDTPKRVLVPTDLLYQCYQNLFPAERMIVVAGRIQGGKIILGAGFDVTGSASAGHVRADPRKLGQALIAMTAANTHMAAWFHSHPGKGPSSTGPSGTDLKQHSDWLRDYSPRLLSGIFVQDGFLRFWGHGLEEKLITPVLIGEGVSETDGGEHVYRIIPG